MMRKLVAGATKDKPRVVVQPTEIRDPDAHIRHKILEAFPLSFMPNEFVRPSVGSLVAVYLAKQRRIDLGLVGFRDYEPLVAVVRKVVDPDAYKCSWMESQPTKGPGFSDGLLKGYNGRWTVWVLEDGTPAPNVTLNIKDIYANDFKLYESKKMSGPLKRVLKRLLAVAKGDIFMESESEEEL